jgi:hypothetical protein
MQAIVTGGRGTWKAAKGQTLRETYERKTVMKQANDRSIRLAGSTIQPPCHACAFFHSDAESYEVLLPFIKEGVEQGDKSFHIIDERRREEYMNRLRASGIDCSAEMTGQLEVRGWQDTHLRPGSFDQHATLALVGEVLRDAKENGYVNSAGPKEGWLSKIRSGRIRSVVTG